MASPRVGSLAATMKNRLNYVLQRHGRTRRILIFVALLPGAG
jgi:hypothetical protein